MKDIYKIGEVSKMCNISIKTLRYYEEMGLIKPVEVDIYSGYRYYDEKNIKEIYRIQFLKNLNLSLQEIKDFDDNNLQKQIKSINKKIKELKKQKELVSSLINLKGEKTLKPFINDEKVIGKWKFIGSALSKESFLAGEYVEDDDILFQEVVFMPEGQGYWVFDRWSKGEIYHFQGVIYTYEIVDEKLFLSIYDRNNEFELVCVYEKVDDKIYTEDDLRRKDNIDVPFVDDKNVLGNWKTVGFVSIGDKETFNLDSLKTGEDYPLKGLTFNPNGELLIEFGKSISKEKWTKGSILETDLQYNSAYNIREIDGNQYLVFDWKSGDYGYGGRVFGCYVLKKSK